MKYLFSFIIFIIILVILTNCSAYQPDTIITDNLQANYYTQSKMIELTLPEGIVLTGKYSKLRTVAFIGEGMLGYDAPLAQSSIHYQGHAILRNSASELNIEILTQDFPIARYTTAKARVNDGRYYYVTFNILP